MKENKVYSYKSQDALCKAFADEVEENFRNQLEMWEAMAVDGATEIEMSRRRQSKEPKIVWENTYEKLATILTDDRDKTYSKRIWRIFRSRRYVSITWCSGFYDHLLYGTANRDGESLQGMVAINVEYIIDRKNFTVVKKIYQDRIKPR